MILGYATRSMILGLKGQGHRVTVQKHIEGDREFSVSYTLY